VTVAVMMIRVSAMFSLVMFLRGEGGEDPGQVGHDCRIEIGLRVISG
jgi:hypothetical protein